MLLNKMAIFPGYVGFTQRDMIFFSVAFLVINAIDLRKGRDRANRNYKGFTRKPLNNNVKLWDAE